MNWHWAKDLFEEWETLKGQCEFSTVWAYQANFDSAEKDSILAKICYFLSCSKVEKKNSFKISIKITNSMVIVLGTNL